MTKKARVLFIFATVFTALTMIATVFFAITETNLISSGNSQESSVSGETSDSGAASYDQSGTVNSSDKAEDVAGKVVAGIAVGFATAFVFVAILIMWAIASLVLGVPAIVMTACSIKNTKVAIAELIVSVVSTLSPLIYLGVFSLIQ